MFKHVTKSRKLAKHQREARLSDEDSSGASASEPELDSDASGSDGSDSEGSDSDSEFEQDEPQTPEEEEELLSPAPGYPSIEQAVVDPIALPTHEEGRDGELVEKEGLAPVCVVCVNKVLKAGTMLEVHKKSKVRSDQCRIQGQGRGWRLPTRARGGLPPQPRPAFKTTCSSVAVLTILSLFTGSSPPARPLRRPRQVGRVRPLAPPPRRSLPRRPPRRQHREPRSPSPSPRSFHLHLRPRCRSDAGGARRDGRGRAPLVGPEERSAQGQGRGRGARQARGPARGQAGEELEEAGGAE